MTIEQAIFSLIIIILFIKLLYDMQKLDKKHNSRHDAVTKEEPKIPNTSGQIYANYSQISLSGQLYTQIDNRMYYISYRYKDMNDLLSIANRNINLEAMFGYEDLTGKSGIDIYMNSAYIGIQTYEHSSLNIAIIRQCLGHLAIQLGFGSAYYSSAADVDYNCYNRTDYRDDTADVDDNSNNDKNKNVIGIEQLDINAVEDIDAMNADTEKNTKQRSITIL